MGAQRIGADHRRHEAAPLVPPTVTGLPRSARAALPASTSTRATPDRCWRVHQEEISAATARDDGDGLRKEVDKEGRRRKTHDPRSAPCCKSRLQAPDPGDPAGRRRVSLSMRPSENVDRCVQIAMPVSIAFIRQKFTFGFAPGVRVGWGIRARSWRSFGLSCSEAPAAAGESFVPQRSSRRLLRPWKNRPCRFQAEVKSVTAASSPTLYSNKGDLPAAGVERIGRACDSCASRR